MDDQARVTASHEAGDRLATPVGIVTPSMWPGGRRMGEEDVHPCPRPPCQPREAPACLGLRVLSRPLQAVARDPAPSGNPQPTHREDPPMRRDHAARGNALVTLLHVLIRVIAVDIHDRYGQGAGQEFQIGAGEIARRQNKVHLRQPPRKARAVHERMRVVGHHQQPPGAGTGRGDRIRHDRGCVRRV